LGGVEFSVARLDGGNDDNGVQDPEDCEAKVRGKTRSQVQPTAAGRLLERRVTKDQGNIYNDTPPEIVS
jgi:hypothetical protein